MSIERLLVVQSPSLARDPADGISTMGLTSAATGELA